MTTLNEVRESMICPACAHAVVPRVGFLKRLSSIDETQAIIGHEISFECQTCFALFEVDNGL